MTSTWSNRNNWDISLEIIRNLMPLNLRLAFPLRWSINYKKGVDRPPLLGEGANQWSNLHQKVGINCLILRLLIVRLAARTLWVPNPAINTSVVHVWAKRSRRPWTTNWANDALSSFQDWTYAQMGPVESHEGRRIGALAGWIRDVQQLRIKIWL